MKNEKVSVIIPVYNVSLYLEKCLNTVINQTYKNIEIILIDDGSTDNSGIICDEFAKKDNRIIVVHQNNMGLSGARNSGIKLSTGNYICCIDSDDFVSLDYIEILLQALNSNNTDIAACGVVYCDNQENIIRSQAVDKKIVLYSDEQLKTMMLDDRRLSTVAWGKIYKRFLFDDVEYPIGKYHEDIYTTYKLLSKAKSTIVISKAMYYYRQSPNSITHEVFNLKHLDSLDGCIERKKYIDIYHPSLNKVASATIAYSACKILEKMFACNYTDKKIEARLRSEIRKNLINLILVSNCSFQTKIFAFVSSMNVSLSKGIYNVINQKR